MSSCSGPSAFSAFFCFGVAGDIDPLVEGHAEFGRQSGKQLARVAAGFGEDFGREQPHHDAVLVGGPDRSVPLEERGAGAFFAGKTERAAAEPLDEPFESDRRFDQLAVQLSSRRDR